MYAQEVPIYVSYVVGGIMDNSDKVFTFRSGDNWCDEHPNMTYINLFDEKGLKHSNYPICLITSISVPTWYQHVIDAFWDDPDIIVTVRKSDNYCDSCGADRIDLNVVGSDDIWAICPNAPFCQN